LWVHFYYNIVDQIKISTNDTSNDNDKTEDQIRNDSIRGLNLLVQLVSIQVQQQLQQQQQSSINEIIKLILSIGQNGIEKQCAMNDDDADDYDDY
jgi:hypothetical protein